jgi:hypothetical protein
LLDHKGFRLIAQSLLPLGSSSLVYGSSDGGNTVRSALSQSQAQAVATLCRQLNLKPHTVRSRRDGDTGSVCVFSAADVEGHLGTDGRFYLLDVSRTFPPVRPDRENAGSFLFQLFRPQFVARYPIPLCADAYSQFVKGADDEEEHKREVYTPSNISFH